MYRELYVDLVREVIRLMGVCANIMNSFERYVKTVNQSNEEREEPRERRNSQKRMYLNALWSKRMWVPMIWMKVGALVARPPQKRQ